MWKQKVIACYSRAYCKYVEGMWRVYADGRKLGIGLSEDAAWAEAYTNCC